MNYIYNPRVKTIKRVMKNPEEIQLTYIEGRLLEAILNGQVNTWGEISNYVYGFYSKSSLDALRNIKKKILKKVNLNIRTVCAVRSYVKR